MFQHLTQVDMNSLIGDVEKPLRASSNDAIGSPSISCQPSWTCTCTCTCGCTGGCAVNFADQ